MPIMAVSERSRKLLTLMIILSFVFAAVGSQLIQTASAFEVECTFDTYSGTLVEYIQQIEVGIW